jgi:hypothetical protein
MALLCFHGMTRERSTQKQTAANHKLLIAARSRLMRIFRGSLSKFSLNGGDAPHL